MNKMSGSGGFWFFIYSWIMLPWLMTTTSGTASLSLPLSLPLSLVVVNVPVDGSRPKVYNKIATMVVKKMKGINTIIQETMDRPLWHSTFSKTPTMISTIPLKKAVLYTPLNTSKIIWTRQKIIKINAGGHILSSIFCLSQSCFNYIHYFLWHCIENRIVVLVQDTHAVSWVTLLVHAVNHIVAVHVIILAVNLDFI